VLNVAYDTFAEEGVTEVLNFDAYYEGLNVNVRDQFNLMLKVGLPNSDVLKTHPVEWLNGSHRILSGTVVRESSDGLTLNVGSLPAACAALLLPRAFRSEQPSASTRTRRRPST